MVVNEELRFRDVDLSVKRAFLGVPDKILLLPAVQLYKWTSHPMVNGGRITPWWSFVKTTRLPGGMVADGFRTSEERAVRLGRSHREFARARAAVSGQFRNTMKTLLVIQLNTEIWGFAGKASGQREFAEDQTDLQNVYLIGGAHQVWVPNLMPKHVTALAGVS
jgi:hypothetical protein